MNVTRTRGFTLIELLTVIAIIAILASMTFTVGPRMILRAKLAQAHYNMDQLEIELMDYYQEHNTFPPAYGFISFDNRSWDPGTLPDVPGDRYFQDYYQLDSWLGLLGRRGVEDYYDNFATSGDTDLDGVISPLEYIPAGSVVPPLSAPDDTTTLWNGVPANPPHMMNLEGRPFIYLPINKMQFQKLKRYWDATPDGSNPGSGVVDQSYANSWDQTGATAGFPIIAVPPATYDACVLISVGPVEDTCGILPQPLGTEQSLGEAYQSLALRAAYLASRDQDGDGALDFDYDARAKGKSKGHYFPPWAKNRGGQGPIIKLIEF